MFLKKKKGEWHIGGEDLTFDLTDLTVQAFSLE